MFRSIGLRVVLPLALKAMNGTASLYHKLKGKLQPVYPPLPWSDHGL